MNIIKTSMNGDKYISAEDLMLKERKMFLSGIIGLERANEITTAIIALKEESNDPIDVVLNSPSIDLSVGLILCEAIHSSGAPIRLYACGLLEDIAAILFMGAEHERYMTPHAFFRLRFKDERDFRRNMGFVVEEARSEKRPLYIDIVEYLIDHTKIDNVLINLFDNKEVREIRLTAADCVQYGLCDRVVDLGFLIDQDKRDTNSIEGYQMDEDEFDTDFWTRSQTHTKTV